jgi:DNA-binding NtrC family response regulator
MERRIILQVLERTGGHYEAAAELLGISRRTLSRKLKRYGKLAEIESFAAC